MILVILEVILEDFEWLLELEFIVFCFSCNEFCVMMLCVLFWNLIWVFLKILLFVGGCSFKIFFVDLFIKL